jgi:hypothetical protein
LASISACRPTKRESSSNSGPFGAVSTRRAESAVGAEQCEPVRREREALGGRVRASAPPAADADGGFVVASAAHDRDACSQVQLSLELVLDDEPTDVVDDLVEERVVRVRKLPRHLPVCKRPSVPIM